MAITSSRYATNDSDLHETNVNTDAIKTNTTHNSLGGFSPETAILTTLTNLGDTSDYKVDSRGNMNVRGQVLTDEGSYREEFVGTTLYHTLVGTVTFTNGSRFVTGSGTAFTNKTFGYSDYIKLSTDTDASYARIESITSATTLTLVAAYTGTGGAGTGYTSSFTPLTGTGGSFTFGSSLANVISGTTTASVTKLFRSIDYCPLTIVVNATISQRIANQTAYIGMSDNVASPTISAFFQFDGTNANVVKLVTQSTAAAADIDTDTINLSTASTVSKRYKVEINQEAVLFTIDDILVGTHKNHIPTPYAYMNGVIGWVNGTSPASTSTIAIDNVYVGNYDSVSIYNNSIVGTVPNQASYTRPATFYCHVTLTRAANTSAYPAMGIINHLANSTLPVFDFSAYGNLIGKTVRIKQVQFGMATPRNLTYLITNQAAMGSQVWTDRTVFAPAAADFYSCQKTVVNYQPDIYVGGIASSMDNENPSLINAQMDIDANNKLYLVLISVAGFTPASGELFDISIKGEIF